MATKRKQYTAAFKAQVALAALKGDKTVGERAGHDGAHPTLIRDWKRQLPADAEAQKARLFVQIGRLKLT